MSYPRFLQQLSDLEKITLPWKTKDGRKIWLQSIFKKIYHDSGELIGFISTSGDITAEVEAKEQLE
jgi:PAS domain S-box-containing protein